MVEMADSLLRVSYHRYVFSSHHYYIHDSQSDYLHGQAVIRHGQRAG